MRDRLLALGVTSLTLMASCSAPPPVQSPRAAAREVAPQAKEPVILPLTIDGYKRDFAQRVALASRDTFDDPLPEMLKSIVVLEVTIDREGRLAHLAVRRSNGYRSLENVALDSVRRAAPYGAPSWSLRRGDGSVSFLETFLFRDDGRFQIRSLVE